MPIYQERAFACDPAGTTQAIGIICALLLKKRQEVSLEKAITLDIQEIVTPLSCQILLH